MKRYFISGFTLLLTTLAIAPMAKASNQTNLNDMAADLNEDGVVTILELKEYNMDARGS